jgi:hypothetical protein
VVLDDEQVVTGRDGVTGRGSGGEAVGSVGQDPVR